MPIVNNLTPNRSYKKPFGTNKLSDEVGRLIEQITAIDTDVQSAITGLAGKVDVSTLALYQAISGKDVANGYAALNGSGQLNDSVIPLSVLGGMNYKGTWNASTNSPAIPAAAAGNKGWFYIVATQGSTMINGENDWELKDWIVSNGSTWSKIDNTDRVASVAGKSGNVILVAADISNSTAAGQALLTAATIAAQKTALAIAVADVSGAAPLASPVFSGNPTAPLAAVGDNDLSIANTQFVMRATSIVPMIWEPNATRTIGATDAGALIKCGNAGGCVITIPPNSSVPFEFGTSIDIASQTTGDISVTPGAGVTLQSVATKRKLSAQFSGATIYKSDTDVWFLFGDLKA